jgi:hypothetical protein
MKSYYQALTAASELCNMPEPMANPAKFIVWAEDICELISSIYERDYDQVSDDFREKLVEDGVIEIVED